MLLLNVVPNVLVLPVNDWIANTVRFDGAVFKQEAIRVIVVDDDPLLLVSMAPLKRSSVVLPGVGFCPAYPCGDKSPSATMLLEHLTAVPCQSCRWHKLLWDQIPHGCAPPLVHGPVDRAFNPQQLQPPELVPDKSDCLRGVSRGVVMDHLKIDPGLDSQINTYRAVFPAGRGHNQRLFVILF